MVTCKNCGHEYHQRCYKLQMTLRSEPREGIMENCPKCNQISNHDGPDFY
jgi:hypothetical protein